MSSSRPDISVVIPAYNRVELLRETLQSVNDAAREAVGLLVETVVVDDGSSPPLETALSGWLQTKGACQPRIVRQDNAGSIVARLSGLREASGEFVLFLDSDDRIRPRKLLAHVRQMREMNADVSYSNTIPATVGAGSNDLQYGQPTCFRSVATLAELFLEIQPAPHAPVYRREFLAAATANPFIPSARVFDATGDTWLYFNAAHMPGTVTRLSEPLSVCVVHEAGRFSNNWERLGVSALGLSLVFAAKCPQSPEGMTALSLLGAAAFRSYRRLPRRFHREYERLTLRLFQLSPQRESLESLGGRRFAAVARLLGASAAARFFRLWQAKKYSGCQTIPREELEGLFQRALDHVRELLGDSPKRAELGI